MCIFLMCKELFLVYIHSAGWWKQSLQSKSCHFIVSMFHFISFHCFNVKASRAIGIWSLIIRTSSSNVYVGICWDFCIPPGPWLVPIHCGGVCFTLITRSEIALGLACLLMQVCVPDFQWGQTNWNVGVWSRERFTAKPCKETRWLKP